jgi:1,4-dihydroxy-2-naphthoyl-CoA hydrolase
MAIWFDKFINVEQLQELGSQTMIDHIGIKFTEIGENFLKATMPVDNRTIQSYGLLHGGASVTLAETIGSIASAMVIDKERYYCVGLEINANHVRSAKNGFVVGIVMPVHLGNKTHVWEIKIIDNNEKLVCISRLTVAILPRNENDHFNKNPRLAAHL